MPIIRTIRVFENETVEIQWELRDGSRFIDRHTVPPKAVIDAVRRQRQAAGRSDDEGNYLDGRERPTGPPADGTRPDDDDSH